MSQNISRRIWIRQSMIAAGATVLGNRSQNFSSLYLSKNNLKTNSSFWEWESNIPNSGLGLKARLLANENPYGPSQLTQEAVMEAVKVGNRYGHEDAKTLRELLAVKEGVPVEYIMLAPGSSDLLEKVAISHFIEGGEIVSADPAYMSLIKTATAMQAEWKKIPLTSDYAHDLVGMKKAINSKTQLVYICNPNNPTGTITKAKDLKEFCLSVAKEVPVFVDEAYLEFMKTEDKESMVGLVASGHNIIVSRTFSKVYGMAGLRIGYVIALPSTLDKIRSIWRSNMGLNITALKAAIAALGDSDFVDYSVHNNNLCRKYVCAELESMGFDYLPSQTSFVLFPIEMNGDQFLDRMRTLGVGVRSFQVLGKTHCRVSMGTMDEMKLFISSLKEILV